MKKPGQVALTSFPQVDLMPGKRRPILLIAPVPGPYEDWLVCMFSTKLQQALRGFDEIINSNASDFHGSGLEVPIPPFPPTLGGQGGAGAGGHGLCGHAYRHYRGD